MCVFNRVNMCIIGIPNMRVHQEMSTCMYIYIHNKEHRHLTQQRWITWICSPAKATWGFDQLKPMVSQEDSIELSSIKLITCGASRMYRASRLTKIPKAPRAGFQGVFQLRNALSHWIHTEVQTLGTRLHDPILAFYIAFLAKSERWSCKSLMFAGRIRKKKRVLSSGQYTSISISIHFLLLKSVHLASLIHYPISFTGNQFQWYL